MAKAPIFHIDPARFWQDPYPDLERMRREAPIAFVPELGSILLTRRDDIFVCEKNVAVFSSHQPAGLMNRLMGHNMMRKDGEAHLRERHQIFPSVSPRTVKQHWTRRFREHARQVRAVSIRSDGEIALTGDIGGRLYLWDCRTGEVQWLLPPHGAAISAAHL